MSQLERAIRSMLQCAHRVSEFQYRLRNEDFWGELEELKRAIAKVDELRAGQT